MSPRRDVRRGGDTRGAAGARERRSRGETTRSGEVDSPGAVDVAGDRSRDAFRPRPPRRKDAHPSKSVTSRGRRTPTKGPRENQNRTKWRTGKDSSGGSPQQPVRSFRSMAARFLYGARGFPPSPTRGRRRSWRGGNAESGQGGSTRSSLDGLRGLPLSGNPEDGRGKRERGRESERNVNETDVAIFHRQVRSRALLFCGSRGRGVVPRVGLPPARLYGFPVSGGSSGKRRRSGHEFISTRGLEENKKRGAR